MSVSEPTPVIAVGALPQSDALAEASVDSIGHLWSLDPEKMTPEEFKQLIANMRLQRARWDKASNIAKSTGKQVKRNAVKDASLDEPGVSTTTANLGDLDI